MFVTCRNEKGEHVDKWRVWWGENQPPIKGLTDLWFDSRYKAQCAAENVFVPMVAIAPLLVKADVKVSADRVLL